MLIQGSCAHIVIFESSSHFVFLYSCKINPLTFLCPIFVIFYYGKSAAPSYVMLSPMVAGRCVVLPHPFVPLPVSLVAKPLIAATVPS